MVELRKRKQRVSYAALFPPLSDEEEGSDGGGSDAEAGPSSAAVGPPALSVSSGSEFSGGSEKGKASEESEAISDGVDDELESLPGGEQDIEDNASDIAMTVAKAKAGLAKAAVGRKSKLDSLPALVQANTAISERMELLQSLRNSTHAQRPYPLWEGAGERRRLVKRPTLFDGEVWKEVEPEDTTDAWSQVLSPGPAWELVENKGWYKEVYLHETSAEDIPMDVDSPAKRSSARKGKGKAREPPPTTPKSSRPRVYQAVTVDRTNMAILSKEDALPYLPTGRSNSSWLLGEFDKLAAKDIPMLASHRMDASIAGSKSHVFNAGAPVWAIDWCPVEDEGDSTRAGIQYLAVGTYPSHDFSPEIGSRLQRPSAASIQIWSLRPSDAERPSEDDTGVITCEMVLCVDCGPAYALRWCPLPSHDSRSDSSSSTRKLGVLAGVFGDGSISFFVVPDADDLRRAAGNPNAEAGGPLFVRLADPILRFEIDGTAFWSLDWANSEVIAAGCTNGDLLVYHVKDHLSQQLATPLLPSLVKRVHQAAIRSLVWIRAPPSDTFGRLQPGEDPTLICSVGWDGEIFFTEIRDESTASIARYRDVINSVAFSTWAGGPVLAESDTIKWFNTGPYTFGKGHHLMMVNAVVWSIATSDYHPFVASAAADGSLQIVNLLRVPRRGYNIIKTIYKIYQMDFNRQTKEYRVLEQFLPTDTMSSRAAKVDAAKKKKASSKKKGSKQTQEDSTLIGSVSAWPAEIAVHCVAWNPNGLGKAQLLASGTASGLCRIDNLWGWRSKVTRKKAESDEDIDMEE